MPEPEHRNVRTLDARSLRGLAHPLRMQLLRALRLHGPATASQLAGRLGESSGATSYHLRQLAAHGFVEDAPEHGKGRERWWRAVAEGVSFDENLLHSTDPDTRGAADTYLHEIGATHAREVSTWVATREDWLPAWSHATDMSDFTLRLGPARAAELIAKMHELIEGYRDQDESPDAEHVRVHTHVFPFITD
ncbi:transcriptional regulator [Streptomyces sp. Ru71]|uniref:ArsR/SmtB family transcription factor n=1 Tax=Streptomyces sp. Ru71 TaxID=2080746 RepID=UPI000CDD5F97|nr:helix-turn-helix domain-containing protein [Streptomyces sp. Ru71]POX49432.1 transcriptional regulator [Streptomyces sp. Ru71]